MLLQRGCSAEGGKEFPETHVGGVYESHVPGAIAYMLCLQSIQCAGGADSMTLDYFPAGVAWDCVEIEVEQEGRPG